MPTESLHFVRIAIVSIAFVSGLPFPRSQDQSSTPPAQGNATQLEPPKRVRVSKGVAQGLLVKKVDLVYPVAARAGGIQGVVVLQAVISKEGDVIELKLISGHPMLAPATIEAVRKWKYRAYQLNGEPVEIETQIQVSFTLPGS